MSIAPRENLQTYLRNEIVSGRLPPGRKLPSERELAEQFGLSRPVVREVLYGLSDGGLVDIQPSRGTFVRAATTTDGVKSLDTLYRRREATVRELTDARLMLETHAARLAALHATEMEIRTLRWALDEMNEARHVLEEAQLDLAFHALVVRASHNMVIEISYASISSLTFELMLRSLSDRKVKQMGTPYHDTIWQAIADHDPDAAADAMGEHIELARHLYGEDFDRSVNFLARREIHRQLGPSVSLDSVLQEVERRHSEHMQSQFALERARSGGREALDAESRPPARSNTRRN